MFNAPPVLGTEVFARIPDQYRKAGQLSNERLQAGKGTLKTDSYIEGPSFDREGNLYIVDIAFGLIYQISPQGVVKLVAEYDGEPNGLKIHQDGRIFIADHKNGLMLLDQPQKYKNFLVYGVRFHENACLQFYLSQLSSISILSLYYLPYLYYQYFH